MMAYQKAPQHHSIAPHLVNAHHRRHPSAPPAVIVQPTRTPGLLSLSKPPRPSTQRQPHQQRSQPRTPPKAKSAAATPVVSPVPPAPLLKAVEIKTSRPSTPEKNLPQSLRGRPVKAAKDKTAKRSASNTSVHGRRNHTRQPSPPIQPPQAEVAPSTQSNQFDPFLDNFSHDSGPVRAAPTLTARPSGKLAKRRQPIPFALQEPVSLSKAVNVPRRAQAFSMPQVSRSDPSISHMPRNRPQNIQRPPARRSVTVASIGADGFPICDDVTEVGNDTDLGLASDLDDDSSDSSTGPVTPPRKGNWQQGFLPSGAFEFDDGPRTAPLSGTNPGSFPFLSPTPPARTLRTKHVRAPSEGTNAIFHMSSDEESSPSKGLYRTSVIPPRRTGSAGLILQKERGTPASLFEKGCYFASSTFQNSPSPEALPPPAF
ncbi:hypothetical protein HGRIS_011532 [Hohenbuehelia grisea]|uniref:Uncharacterized protein n=1 Tax=Hohenbuehelia grisea TaxID=104357 RepID=A0ABR3JW75_9AGAR